MPEIKRIVADLEAGRRRNPASIPPVMRPLFSARLQPYLVDLFSYDPVTIARDNGIESVKKNAPDAKLDDQTA